MRRERFVVLRGSHYGSNYSSSPNWSIRGELDDTEWVDPSVTVEEVDKSEVVDLQQDSSVMSVAPVMPMRLISPMHATHAESLGQASTWGVEAVEADKSAFAGKGITVAVLDTGIDANHEAFRGVELIQRDFTGEGDGDQNGHGTHCMGTLLGRDSKGLRYGVAPGVNRAVIGKVLDKNGMGSTDSICEAIIWAMEKNAQVISMSLGLDFPGYVKLLVGRGFPVDLATSKALEGYRSNNSLFHSLASLVRARNAVSKGAVLIAAAGNESRRDLDPSYEIAVGPPAATEGIVAVGALEQTGDPDCPFKVADFSNTGATISAPGVNIYSAKCGGGYALLSGTSMAVPHVAGVAALWAENLVVNTGKMDAATLIARLGGQARFLPGLETTSVGIGLVQAP